MLKNLAIIAVAGLMACTSAVVLARGGGGTPGGTSAAHISNQGIQNTNGQNSLDRDKGLERAEDRMSQEGLAHEKADGAKLKKKGHQSPKGSSDGQYR